MQAFDIAQEAILSAGKAVMKIYQQDDFDIQEKSDDSPVTKADLASEQVILDKLKRLNYGILSEETDEENGRLEKSRVWVIDPLDGTKDFIHRTGDFSIMIGLVEDGQPIMGLVYQPEKDTLYYALKGKGSYQQIGDAKPRKLAVSSIESLWQSRMFVSRMHLGKLEESFAQEAKVKEFVKHGSAGLKSCKVAANVADIYIISTDKTKEWDICASHLIVTEAGGKITDLNGDDITFNKVKPLNLHGVLVTNGIVHGAALEVIDDIKSNG